MKKLGTTMVFNQVQWQSKDKGGVKMHNRTQVLEKVLSDVNFLTLCELAEGKYESILTIRKIHQKALIRAHEKGALQDSNSKTLSK